MLDRSFGANEESISPTWSLAWGENDDEWDEDLDWEEEEEEEEEMDEGWDDEEEEEDWEEWEDEFEEDEKDELVNRKKSRRGEWN
jgi:hypothetical protein